MQQRGSNRLNVHRDDVMKHELQGMLRGEHATRAEEWRDPEPLAEDDPALARGWVPPRSSRSVEEAENEALRFELACFLRRSVFPANRRELLRTMFEANAPSSLVETVRELPSGHSFVNVQEVVDALGRKPNA